MKRKMMLILGMVLVIILAFATSAFAYDYNEDGYNSTSGDYYSNEENDYYTGEHQTNYSYDVLSVGVIYEHLYELTEDDILKILYKVLDFMSNKLNVVESYLMETSGLDSSSEEFRILFADKFDTYVFPYVADHFNNDESFPFGVTRSINEEAQRIAHISYMDTHQQCCQNMHPVLTSVFRAGYVWWNPFPAPGHAVFGPSGWVYKLLCMNCGARWCY